MIKIESWGKPMLPSMRTITVTSYDTIMRMTVAEDDGILMEQCRGAFGERHKQETFDAIRAQFPKGHASIDYVAPKIEISAQPSFGGMSPMLRASLEQRRAQKQKQRI